ncbi:MAG TPA: glycosyltransferase family 4 protein [Geothrix sp.]|nr:glycosyltransferase family 4 protein [Geothrix sp.]
MEILYVSVLRSQKRFAELLRDQAVKPPQQIQKFHGLLARGLAPCVRELTALSVIPNPAGKSGFPRASSESEDGISFRYFSLKMIPVLSHVLTFSWSFFSCLRWSLARRGQARFLICDALDLSISSGALFAAKLTGTHAVTIVTDIPDYMYGEASRAAWTFHHMILRLYVTLSTFFMERYDGYILLTEAMNGLVNPKGRPHLIMEGIVDPGMGEVPNTLAGKYAEQVVIYAGALYARYGVASLLEAFLQVPDPNARLWLYGSGELESKLQDYADRDSRITYWGVKPNAEVVAAEVRATLLVNPRPAEEAFTKYSFPSKNMEYMASGTPVLTAPLPGMPKEYLEHVYTFPASTAEDLAASLSDLLGRPREELHLMGLHAKTFVLTQKNSLIQGRRVHTFLQTLA